MADESLMKRVIELRTSIDRWNYEYYILNQSSVPDSDYDQALNELPGNRSRATRIDHARFSHPAGRYDRAKRLRQS